MSGALLQLGEHHIGMFLLQVLLVLGLARGLGCLFERIGQPALVGELLTGVVLGPTLLGRVAPAVHAWLFPAGDVVQAAMLGTFAWVGLLLLLLSAGTEVDVTVAWRQRGHVVGIAAAGLTVPLALSCGAALLLPDRYLADPSQRVVFALFVATALTIAALPMTVRALYDLDLLKSDLGLLVMASLVIHEVVGWAVFTLILSSATQARLDVTHVAVVVGGTVAFTAACMTLGRPLVARGIAWVQKGRPADTGLVLTLVCCVGLLAGFITHSMGIHALLGLFLAGVMAGGAPALSERTRHAINQMVYAVFVPVFFASLGLQVDFVANFDPFLALLFATLGIGGKFLGAWTGARLAGVSRWERRFIAIAHTPGGSMEMVVALVALQEKLITVPVFVAIVFAALVSSIVLGPWLAWTTRQRRALNVLDIFLRRAMRLDLHGSTRWEAIHELCEAAAEQGGLPKTAVLNAAVRAREEMAGTSIGEGMAVPHARIAGLSRPLIVFGRAVAGFEWDAPDGLPAHFVFLILTPADDQGLQVQILGALARGLGDEPTRHKLLAARTEAEAWTLLRQALAQQNLARRSAPRGKP
ncbi:MAG TPA: cation:proton antiporter [Planctomycetota bacterium]|nr:cation:proton antiporter [Planctomycetota bacterium]